MTNDALMDEITCLKQDLANVDAGANVLMALALEKCQNLRAKSPGEAAFLSSALMHLTEIRLKVRALLSVSDASFHSVTLNFRLLQESSER